jgi:signal transduction histidine kinase
MAGDLHDEVLPALFQVHLMGEVVRHDLASGRLLELEEDIASLLQATTAAQSSIREVVGGLRTSPLGPDGLPGAIGRIAEHLQALSAPRIKLDVRSVSGSDRSLLVALQVVREALGNAAKHARADSITVSVDGQDGRILVVVEDDGTGFDPSAEYAGHYGILLMRERVQAAGGTFEIDSRIGHGVAVRASVPVDL